MVPTTRAQECELSARTARSEFSEPACVDCAISVDCDVDVVDPLAFGAVTDADD
jgi:hypothetical protein